MASQGVDERLTQSIVQRLPPSMQGFWCGHGAPVVFNGEKGGKRLDVFSTHVNDDRQVVGIAVSLNREAVPVDASSGNRSAQPFVIEAVPCQRLNQGFKGFIGDALGGE